MSHVCNMLWIHVTESAGRQSIDNSITTQVAPIPIPIELGRSGIVGNRLSCDAKDLTIYCVGNFRECLHNWCWPRSSKPVGGVNNAPSGFDSHTLPLTIGIMSQYIAGNRINCLGINSFG